MPAEGPKGLLEVYAATRSDYECFTIKLAGLLRELLIEFGIDVQAIDQRVKTLESLERKAQRKEHIDSLDRIHDLAGIRLIMYLNADVERASVMIDKYFEVDSAHSSDKRKGLHPDQFSYSSVHKVVRISSDRAKMPEWQRFVGLCAEVQIRTVLEHAWAVISHKVQYKREGEVPPERHRDLNRLSALLESVDMEFTRLRSEADSAFKSHSDLSEGPSQIAEDLSQRSVEQFLASPIVERIAHAAIASGFSQTSTEFWLADGSYLLRASSALGLSTIVQLEAALQAPPEKINAFFTALRARRGSLRGDRDFFAALLLVARHHGKPSAVNAEGLWEHQLPSSVLAVGREVFV
jgi:putative GTP pyrophosphokinase